MRRPYLSESIKKRIAGQQLYKCANKNNLQLKGIENYSCPLWNSINNGSFDESGYEIDHIEELSISNNNNITNLQALCRSCHLVKTKRFMNNNNKDRKNVPALSNNTSSICNIDIFEELGILQKVV